jgi:hypothetical protein
MKLGTLIVAALAGLGIVFFLRQRREVESLRADRPAPKVKKKTKGILDARPVVQSLFNLATEQFGWAPAPQYRFEDTAAIYRENERGLNREALLEPHNPEEANSFSW